ncbi:MAG: hypothetical protein AB7O80_19630 [Acetobacteraceae bacterium]
MDTPRHEDFVPYVDAVFRFDGWSDPLRLAAVDVATRLNPGIDRHPFTLVFRGARNPVLPEGMRRVIAPDGRAFDIYVMPIHTPAPGHQDYQAVFN